MMARNTLKVDFSGFNELITKLDDINGDIKEVSEKALNYIGQRVTDETIDALQKHNLPAGGIYSTGDTEESVVKNPRVEWIGSVGSIGVGFDYSKPGAGGYLIKGSPRHRPAAKLNMIYTGKSYAKHLQEEMMKIVNEAICDKMEG
jgi:hypothetical protein